MSDNGPKFFQTRMGATFYDHTMPRIADALEQLAKVAAGLQPAAPTLPGPHLVLTVTVPCAPNIPDHVREWMAENIAAHVQEEFGVGYQADWVTPTWDGPPLPGRPAATVRVTTVTR
jgi:hypothetical protein